MYRRYQGRVPLYMDHSRVRTQQQDSCLLLYIRRNTKTAVRALQASHRLYAWFYMAWGLKNPIVWHCAASLVSAEEHQTHHWNPVLCWDESGFTLCACDRCDRGDWQWPGSCHQPFMENEGSNAINWLPNPPFLNLIRHLWECREIPDILIQVWEEPITRGPSIVLACPDIYTRSSRDPSASPQQLY